MGKKAAAAKKRGKARRKRSVSKREKASKKGLAVSEPEAAVPATKTTSPKQDHVLTNVSNKKTIRETTITRKKDPKVCAKSGKASA